MFEKKFDEVLEQDEKIISTFKTDPRPTLVASLIVAGIPLLIYLIIFVIIYISFSVDTDYTATDFFGSFGGIMMITFLVFFLILAVMLIIISLIFTAFTFYAYTNKRLIIRSGIFGTTFRSLYLNQIGAVNVNLGLWDKIFKSGTIKFGSSAADPSAVGYGRRQFCFKSIKMPYDIQKRILLLLQEARK